MASSKAGIYISKFTNPYINLAIENRLFTSTSFPRHEYSLLLWKNSPSIVIGRNQNPWRECNLFKMKEKDIKLVRRNSGGGAVYHDLGNANYSIMMPRSQFDRRLGASLVNRALHWLDIPSEMNERYDIVIDKLKVSGSAFKLVRDRAYHHGTMLIDSELDTLSGLLHPTVTNLEGLGTASVKSPVTRLREHSFTVTYEDFVESVSAEFSSFVGHRVNSLILDDKSIPDLIGVSKDAQTYQEWEWLYGQTPSFSHHVKLTHEPEVNLKVSVVRGLITETIGDSRVLSTMFKEDILNMPYDKFVQNLLSSNIV